MERINAYRSDIDLLKGIAIIAVVLYHMGVSRSGYLGVDAFFVINGFLIMPKVIREVDSGQFRYFAFVEKRIFRLLPLMLIVTSLSILVGYWGMLPDDYENLCESVIATNFFSNNILASVTTKNYWDVSNEYKALMHTWYIGILFEFYVVFPMIVKLVKWLSKMFHVRYYKFVFVFFLCILLVSLLLYLNPRVSTGEKFYLLYYRFFELVSGGLAGIWVVNHCKGRLYRNGTLSFFVFILLILVMFVGVFYVGERNTSFSIVTGAVSTGDSFVPQWILLLVTVFLTLVFVILENLSSSIVTWMIRIKMFCLLGMMSYSLFIWHQPMLAFYRYFISNDLSLIFVLLFLITLYLLSYLSYHYVEQKVRVNFLSRIIILVAFVLINCIALVFYLRAGVVRDVPELNVRTDNVHRNMHAEYVDRIFAFNKDFDTNSKKIKVLVIGNSFARDWCNVLLESEQAESICLSYISNISKKHIKRIKIADYIFICDWKHNVPDYLWENVKCGADVWGVGTKNFGESNGIIYKNRKRPDYFMQTIKINPNFLVLNRQLKEEWKDKYIDLLELSMVNGDGSVVVFSQDNKFLSQDTRHLSKGGAEFFARKIDFKKIFSH